MVIPRFDFDFQFIIFTDCSETPHYIIDHHTNPTLKMMVQHPTNFVLNLQLIATQIRFDSLKLHHFHYFTHFTSQHQQALLDQLETLIIPHHFHFNLIVGFNRRHFDQIA